MAKKKVAPAKPARQAGGKTAAKKTSVKAKPAPATGKKTAPKPALKSSGKATVKKVVAKKSIKADKIVSKKAVAPKKALPKKVVAVKKVVSKSAKTNAKPEFKPTSAKIKGPSEILTDAIVEGILEVKGRNISVLNLKDVHNRVCDYFIICQADSNTQVNAIAGSVEVMVKKLTGERPYRKEGFENSEWILVDYVTVVVHIFQTEVRNFYNLESLWADADVTEIAFDK